VNKLTKPKKAANQTLEKSRPAPAIAEETAKLTATEYCLFHYPTLYTAGAPCLGSERNHLQWSIPILLVSPVHGVLGEVGTLHIDARSGKVIGASDRAEVVARGEKLYRGISDGPAPSVPATK
jgi:hypothetical protein